MLSKSNIRLFLQNNLPVLLISSGAGWENLFGPGYLGWGLILFGFILDNWLLNRRWMQTPHRWSLFLLLLLATVSLWVTTNMETTLAQFDRLVSSLVLCVAIYQWANNKQRLLWAAAVFTTLGLGLAVAAPVIVSWHENKTGFIPNSVYQWFPLLLSDAVHPNVMATLMLVVWPLPFAFFLTIQHSKWLPYRLIRMSGAVVAVYMGGILLLTRSRGGYIAAAVAVVTVLWLSRQRFLALLITVTSAAAGFWFASDLSQVSSAAVSAVADTDTLSFRLMVWQTAVSMIRDFPFTGVGMGTFNDVAVRLYPFPIVSTLGTHNLYLQVAVDLGLIGLIAFLAIVCVTIAQARMAYKAVRQSDDKLLQAAVIGLFAGFISFLVHGLVDITVWGTRMAFWPWVLIALLTAVYHITVQEQTADFITLQSVPPK